MIYLSKTLSIAAVAVLGGYALTNDNQTGSEGASVTEVTAVGEAGMVEVPALIPRDIDLALCLDTSGSMEGLLDSARQRLWALVNDLALAEPTPRIRVALLTYGTPAYGEESGFVQVSMPLTEDLDMVSLKLFELTTNGGDEFVARVTQTAASQLEWSQAPQAMKMIVVAGNESAEQDAQVTLEKACGMAIAQGIVVNSLFCAQLGVNQQSGSVAQGVNRLASNQVRTPIAVPAAARALQPLSEIALGWKKVSTLADGAFAVIDQNSGVQVIETPFDEQLIKLSSVLNETYIPYGAGSSWFAGNQIAQDGNASGLNRDAAAGRAQTKAGKLYFCSWDLVDSLDRGQLTLAEVKTDDLPEELRKLSSRELKLHIDEMRKAREKVQGQISRIGTARETWLATKRAELGTDTDLAFDTPLRKAFRELAEARGFRFAKPETAQAELVETAPVTETAPATRNW